MISFLLRINLLSNPMSFVIQRICRSKDFKSLDLTDDAYASECVCFLLEVHFILVTRTSDLYIEFGGKVPDMKKTSLGVTFVFINKLLIGFGNLSLVPHCQCCCCMNSKLN